MELRIEDGRVLPKVEQHQVKVYASDKYLSLDEVVQKAAVGLATVMSAARVELAYVTLHVWYFGKPVKSFLPNYSALCQQYRDTYLAQMSADAIEPRSTKKSGPATILRKAMRAVVGESALPRVAIELHQAEEVLGLLPPTLKAVIERLPEPWTVKKT